MGSVKTKDGAEIYFKDWGAGRPVLFSHGWPLSADAWDAQMLFLGQQGYRVIAHDRRGHGRSSQTWEGNEMNTYADDLAAVIDALDLKGRDSGGSFDRRRRGRAIHRPARDQTRGASSADRRSAAAHAQDGRRIREACRSPPSTRSGPASQPTVRSFSRNSRCLSTATTNRARRYHRACRIPFGCKGCRLHQGRIRLYQGLLRDGFHGGPQEIRRAHVDPARRCGSDRADRSICPDVIQDREETRRSRSIRALRTGCARPLPTR